MKIANIMINGEEICAVKTEEGLIPAYQLAEHTGNKRHPSVADVVSDPSYLSRLRSSLERRKGESHVIKESSTMFSSPLGRPEKILCIGLNYRNHALETKKEIPENPTVFSKFNNAIAAHNQDILIPDSVRQLDYEGELGIMIGKTAKKVPIEDSMNYVFGFFVGNDVSARDLQYRTTQWLLGKTSDAFFPAGPYITTADEIPDPQNLRIMTKLNGEVRQNSNTSNMIFRCDFLVSYLSQYMTLRPGDIISTGTPEGVILGRPPEKRTWIKNGDVVEVDIENLGTLRNRFVS
jgi:2-keto-4-pentenoate hydratase/2-oxohepta-3-ene-1,7-dioic acid hydratase in catechol pathway